MSTYRITIGNKTTVHNCNSNLITIYGTYKETSKLKTLFELKTEKKNKINMRKKKQF